MQRGQSILSKNDWSALVWIKTNMWWQQSLMMQALFKTLKETSHHYVTCCAHAIHLAVCDILCMTPKYLPSEAVAIENDLAGDTECEPTAEDEEDSAEVLVVTPLSTINLQNVAKKVRKICENFSTLSGEK